MCKCGAAQAERCSLGSQGSPLAGALAPLLRRAAPKVADLAASASAVAAAANAAADALAVYLLVAALLGERGVAPGTGLWARVSTQADWRAASSSLLGRADEL